MSKRLPDMAPPFAGIRKKLRAYFVEPWLRLSDSKRFWIGFTLLSLITALLIQNPLLHMGGTQYKEGDIIRQTIISPADISSVDSSETEAMKNAARDAIRPIFTFEADMGDHAAERFKSAWDTITQKTEAPANAKPATNTKTSDPASNAASDDAKNLTTRKYNSNEIDSVLRAVRESADGSIFNDSDKQYFQTEITIIDRQKPNQQSIVSLPESSMTALSVARGKLKNRLSEIRSLSPKEAESFYQMAEPFIQPSVIYDSVATTAAKEAASKNILPVVTSLKRGQTVAREGDTATTSVLSQINAIRDYSESTRKWNRFFGLLFLVASLYWIAWKFIEHRGTVARITLSPEITFALFGFVSVIQVALLSIGFRLSDFTASQNQSAPLNDATLWALAIPFAFTSLLMTLLADRRIALFTGIFVSLISGFIASKPLEFVAYSVVSSAVAVYGIGRYRSRQSVTTAGVLVGGANVLIALALIAYTQQPFILSTILLAIACGLAGGIISSAVTAVFLPICESLFGILTDVKLLELSNADLPVLGQLALRAPGTNQHSHAVGHLSEEACRAIGANGLLTRIGALYHDIGKLAAPEHFVENQLGKNPHDKLKPVQSAKIIISHVTYGVKLGKELGLPQRIIDFIPQHHGTRTLHYFLRKAQAQAGAGEEVEESEFRYPGPKPQFKEAAIMMIADSCEAGARALSHPTPENIRFIVTKIIDAILSDDQLDECDLTLRELTLIREAIIKSLVAIYHSRIDYPGYVPSDSSPKITLPEPAEDSEERGIKYDDPSQIPISKGGEIEDEAIDRSSPPEKAKSKTVN